MLLLISGPIASGKSTLARGVAADLGGMGIPTAVVELDRLRHSICGVSEDSVWATARRAARSLAAGLEASGIAVVIVEGSLDRPLERADVLADQEQRVVSVGLSVSYAEALRRARLDPTRGLSRDEAFLSGYWRGREGIVPAHDLMIDTERVGEADARLEIVDRVRTELGIGSRQPPTWTTSRERSE